jgi:hypothetical protein
MGSRPASGPIRSSCRRKCPDLSVRAGPRLSGPGCPDRRDCPDLGVRTWPRVSGPDLRQPDRPIGVKLPAGLFPNKRKCVRTGRIFLTSGGTVRPPGSALASPRAPISSELRGRNPHPRSYGGRRDGVEPKFPCEWKQLQRLPMSVFRQARPQVEDRAEHFNDEVPKTQGRSPTPRIVEIRPRADVPQLQTGPEIDTPGDTSLQGDLRETPRPLDSQIPHDRIRRDSVAHSVHGCGHRRAQRGGARGRCYSPDSL